MNPCRFSSAANSDVEEIVSYIFGLNPVAALHFIDSLEQTCELLVCHPHIGRPRAEFGEGIRSFPIGNYLVFYVPAKDGIEVARIVYGGRDLLRAFQNK